VPDVENALDWQYVHSLIRGRSFMPCWVACKNEMKKHSPTNFYFVGLCFCTRIIPGLFLDYSRFYSSQKQKCVLFGLRGVVSLLNSVLICIACLHVWYSYRVFISPIFPTKFSRRVSVSSGLAAQEETQ
jgi:hypothetical protein